MLLHRFPSASALTMSSPLVVVALEGCHGAGKSELLGQFAKRGYHVLDEGFLDMPEYAIHPQSLLSETCWVCSWFERLLKLKQTATAGGVPAVVFADRSPLSAVYYGHSGHLLEPVIRAHMVEVEQQADVHIVTAHVLVRDAMPLPKFRTWHHCSLNTAAPAGGARAAVGAHPSSPAAGASPCSFARGECGWGSVAEHLQHTCVTQRETHANHTSPHLLAGAQEVDAGHTCLVHGL